MGKKLTKKQKKTNEKIIILKLILSIIYLIVIMILALCSYKIFKEEEIETKWSEVENSNQYSYIYISKMSEKFAYDPTTKKSYHFIIETEETGIWHTYIIAINENDYNKYKKIIDYTYERTSEQPEKIKVEVIKKKK